MQNSYLSMWCARQKRWNFIELAFETQSTCRRLSHVNDERSRWIPLLSLSMYVYQLRSSVAFRIVRCMWQSSWHAAMSALEGTLSQLE
jgi:hypothetical protein